MVFPVGIVTRNFDFKITEQIDFDGVATIKKSDDTAYTLADTIITGDYVKVLANTIGQRTFLKIERA